ncbi:MAG: hypothetical protein ACKO0Z_17315, partial [Betaproteobacteria bacterium]
LNLKSTSPAATRLLLTLSVNPRLFVKLDRRNIRVRFMVADHLVNLRSGWDFPQQVDQILYPRANAKTNLVF